MSSFNINGKEISSQKVFERANIGVTVDVAVMTTMDSELSILLIERKNDPFKGSWALPGGFLEEAEEIETGAVRELFEETNFEIESSRLCQLGTYGDLEHDPRMRTVSVAHIVFVTESELENLHADDDASDVRLWKLSDLEGYDAPDIAFDHAEIIADAFDWVVELIDG